MRPYGESISRGWLRWQGRMASREVRWLKRTHCRGIRSGWRREGQRHQARAERRRARQEILFELLDMVEGEIDQMLFERGELEDSMYWEEINDRELLREYEPYDPVEPLDVSDNYGDFGDDGDDAWSEWESAGYTHHI